MLNTTEIMERLMTINNLTLDLNGYDYLLTFDSDIVFKENIDYISNLIDISTNIENLGVLSLYQEEQNCHLVQLLNKSKSINGFNIIWNKRLQGIAGGCLWIDFNFWKSINGYRVMGVYAGEDSFIFRDAFNNNKFSGLIKNLPVIHPKETNMEYQKWKIKVCQRDTKNKIVRNLTDQITESMNFWNKNS